MIHNAVLSNTFRHPAAQSKCWFIQEFSSKNERIGGFHWQDFDLSDNRYKWDGEKHLLGTLDDVLATLSLHQHTGRHLYPVLVLGHLNDVWCIDVDNKGATDDDLSDTAKLMLDGYFDWDTCVELSKSGSGIHVFGHGATVPEGLGNRGAGIEVYTHQRAVTMTLNWLTTDTPTDSQNVMFDAVCYEYLKPKPMAAKTSANGDVTEFSKAFPDDRAALQQIIMAELRHPAPGAPFAAWVHCDGATLAQHSPRPETERAHGKTAWDGTHIDMLMVGTLVYHLGNDPERIMRIMREQMPAMYKARADKWRRDDYIESTVARAAAMKAGKRSTYGVTVAPSPSLDNAALPVADWPSVDAVEAELIDRDLFQSTNAASRVAQFMMDHYGFDSGGMSNIEKRRFYETYAYLFKSNGDCLPFGQLMTLMRVQKDHSAVLPPDGIYWDKHAKCYFDYNTASHLDVDGFNVAYAHECPKGEDGVRLLAHTFFNRVTDVKPPVVHQTGYRPGESATYYEDGLLCANSWNPAHLPDIVEPDARGEEAINRIQLLALSSANMNTDHADILLSCLSHLVKYPDQRLPFTPLLIGIQGSGKSIFGSIIGATIGRRNIKSVMTDSLLSNFTGWATGTQVNFLDEIYDASAYSARSKAYENLKTLQTEEYVTITAKGKNELRVLNTTSYWAASNHHDAVQLSKNDDRRWFVLCNEAATVDEVAKQVGATTSFRQWCSELIMMLRDDSVAGMVRHWLMHIDDHPAMQGGAPQTQAKVNMSEAAQSPVDQMIHMLLESDEAQFVIPGKCVSVNALTKHLVSMPEMQNDRVSLNIVSKVVRKLGFTESVRYRRNGLQIVMACAPGAIDADMHQLATKLYTSRPCASLGNSA